MPTNRKEYYKKWLENNKDKVKEYEKVRSEKRKLSPEWKEAHTIACKKSNHKIWTENPELALFSRAKARAKSKGTEFTINLEDIVIPEFCPYMGTKLLTGINNPAENTPSLDRIDSSKGYIKGNIQVISAKSNIAKNNLTITELIAFAHGVLNLHNDPKELSINNINSVLQS